MNEIEITFNKIILRLPRACDWDIAKNITGKYKESAQGVFEYVLSTQNMHRILRYFDGDKKPAVVKGREHLDNLRQKLAAYKESKEKIRLINLEERYPVEPNGKFTPFAHQTKIIGVQLSSPYPITAADCGLGKTGSSGRAIEILMEKGEIKRGKVLISAPLTILDTSWGDDLTKFTSLRWQILWTPLTNRKREISEKTELCNLGEKPASTVTVKTKKKQIYKHKVTGRVMLDKPTSLDGRSQDWQPYSGTWKVATTLEGGAIPFGPVIGCMTEIEDRRTRFIQDSLARTDVDVFLINHDGVRIYEDILKAANFDWVIIDEGTKIKNSTSEVTRAHINISWNCKRRGLLGGTPNPNGFEDLWSQFFFLDRGLTLEPSKKDFIAEYFTSVKIMDKQGPAGPIPIFKNYLKHEKKDALIERVRGAGIFLDQRDCIDLPERTDMVRVAYMAEEQESAYRQMAEDLIARLEDKVTGNAIHSEAMNILSQICRLRQITSGFLSNREDELVALSHNPKYEDLDAVIEELGDKKIVVACQFREEIRALIDRYQDLGVSAIYGGVAKEERPDIIRAFQSDPSKRIILLHPAAAAHGITLTAANYMFFLSNSHNFEHYYQVAKRIERIGQRNAMFMIHSLARFKDGTETIDQVILDVLHNKSNDRNAIFGKDTPEQAKYFYDRIKNQVNKK